MPAQRHCRSRQAFLRIGFGTQPLMVAIGSRRRVLTDPWRDVVLQRVRFVPLQGTLADFRLYVLLAPQL